MKKMIMEENNKNTKAEEKNGKKAEKKAEKVLKEKIEALEKENAGLKESVASGKDDYLRLMAEFETFRRRSAQDRLDLVSSASAETIKGLLPVLDDCERAMAMLEESSDEAAKEGTSLIYNKLMAYLKGKGLQKIEAKGQKFDTDFHEAVAQIPVQDEESKGLVYDVIETGYLFGGKVLRYAKVVVGA
ncbi:MAG: nucleotide exchange factor GrpE [Bacteroidales bacterium]|nr:nucleotide exchange factor GrpE [Bacteroidales bacterium]